MLLNLAASVAAVNALIAKHPLLPAPELVPSAGGVGVHLHSGFADFETWREALDIPTGDVLFNNRPSSSTMRAETEFAGVPLTLVGYSSPVAHPVTPLKAVA